MAKLKRKTKKGNERWMQPIPRKGKCYTCVWFARCYHLWRVAPSSRACRWTFTRYRKNVTFPETEEAWMLWAEWFEKPAKRTAAVARACARQGVK